MVAAIDLAERLQLPVEWLPISSGARIAMDSGTENMDCDRARVRRIVTFTQAGGVIHLIVAGINVGAQSYWDALATMLMHTKGVLIMTPEASMVLTGSAALAASGSVSAEDEVTIGGHERVMGPNGQAQYFAADLLAAYQMLYRHYEYTYVVPGEAAPRKHATAIRASAMCASRTSPSRARRGARLHARRRHVRRGEEPRAQAAVLDARADARGDRRRRPLPRALGAATSAPRPRSFGTRISAGIRCA